MSRLDLKRLETFRVVAESGSISAAATLLHLSQPAVTAQVRQLEEAIGRPLFVRTPRGVSLTAEGKTLFAYATRIENLVDEAVGAVAGAEARGGEVHLAASTTVGGYVIPGLFADFRRRESGARLRLEVGNSADVIEQVASGKVPLGVVEGLSRAPRVKLERYLDDEIIAVYARGASRDFACVRRAADLANVPIILREPRSGTRAVVERALAKAVGRRKAHPEDLQLGSSEAIRTAAKLGLGIAFLSRWSIRDELDAGRLRVRPLADLRITRTFSWVLPAGEIGGVTGRFLAHARRSPPPPP